MITLGIAISHNSSASLMIDGKIVGLVQEERITKTKNQSGFPLQAFKSLVKRFLNNDYNLIDEVVYGSKIFHPYGYCLDLYTKFEVEDHIKEMKEVWYPVFYENKPLDGKIWNEKYLNGKNLNKDHNFDFSFINKNITLEAATKHFNDIEVLAPIKKLIPTFSNFKKIDHHKCHAYYALYGGSLDQNELKDVLVLTADAMGDNKNWSVSTVNDNGTLNRLGAGDEFTVARIYKFCTLILGMKPNEHEYKVMGLSAYSKSSSHIKKVETIFSNILDFKDGIFMSKEPLKESYFDLKDRLEGHRFDNISAGLQNWTSSVITKWANYWLKKTNKSVICFSGGLSMNIKANGDLLKSKLLKSISVPASGGDETLSAGACFASAAENSIPITPITSPYLGDEAVFDENNIKDSNFTKDSFAIVDNFDNEKIASLLAKNHIVARCVENSEFGARALGNRSILANPNDINNVKKINDSIKNRDFWMPFTPSILEEYTDLYLENPKGVNSPYMTVGYESVIENRDSIKACLHMGDFSARPQFVSKNLNKNYWDLINKFYQITKIPCLLNTSLNLHGEPMNYTVEDAIRTLTKSSLNFLILPENRLLYKKDFRKTVLQI